MRGSRLVVGLFAPAILLTLLTSAAPATAAPPWTGLSTKEAPAGSPLQSCVEVVKKRKPAAWTCMAGELTVATTDADGGTKFESTMVTDSPNIDTTGDIRIAADDYDTWCETGTTCSRLINDYTAEVKGNGAYGNNGGVIGSFDQVLRQSFDGGTPRWRGHLDWDSGPNVDGFNWIIRCRKSDGAFDSTCGNENPWDPGVIGSIGQRTWIPSETGYRYNSAGLTGSTNKYHDDFYGAFKASGYTTTWSSGTLHTGRWRSCSACKYYQVPWTTTP